MDETIYVLDMPDYQPIYSEKVSYGYHGKRGAGLKKLLFRNQPFSLHVLSCFFKGGPDRFRSA